MNIPKETKAYGCADATCNFEEIVVPLPPFKPCSIHLEVLYCGICGSCIHTARGEWESVKLNWPCVPGHEIIGRVKAVGSDTTKFQVGDLVGVGAMVSSCRVCETCQNNEEQLCEHRVLTVNQSHPDNNGMKTKGGYSRQMVVDEHFCVTIPEAFHDRLAATAPLLCAGITAYDAMLRHGLARKGTDGEPLRKMRVAVVGFGGLGHIAAKFAVHFGHEVTVISRNEHKREDAGKLGAKFALIRNKSDPDCKKHEFHFDYIYDTVGYQRDLMMYIQLATRECLYVAVGIQPSAQLSALYNGALMRRRIAYVPSAIGGIKRTQEMLEYCAENNILADVVVVEPSQIQECYDKVVSGEVKFRYTIKMPSE